MLNSAPILHQPKNQAKSSKQRRLMLFDLALGGHHGNYIKHLIDYWCQHNLAGNLDIVVLPEFLQVHREVTETISRYQQPQVNLIAIAKQEAAALNSRKSSLSRIIRNFQEWELYCHYAVSLQATHSLIMYLDTCEMPLTVAQSSPCPFSGVYFRPTFHYERFLNYKASWQDKLQQIREKLTLSRILRHPQLKNVFCLDPYAVDEIAKFSAPTNVVYLPDPVTVENLTSNDVFDLKRNLGIEDHRQVFLLFGALGGRKGIYQLLDAIAELSSDLCQKLCLLLVGGNNVDEQTTIKAKLKLICQGKPVQIIERFEFIREPEVPTYFQVADVVLSTYQRHVGMSGILLLAAAAGKPVLSSNYGLMGKIVEQHQLGLSVDSSIPSEIAQGLTKFLLCSPQNIGNREKMLAFAQQNSAKKYVKVIFDHLKY